MIGILDVIFVVISVICVGVRSKSLHRIRVEQRSASAAERQHMYSRVPVHAAHVPPQQVSHIKNTLSACAMCLSLLSPPFSKATVDKNQDIDYFVPSESSSAEGSVFLISISFSAYSLIYSPGENVLPKQLTCLIISNSFLIKQPQLQCEVTDLGTHIS